MSATKDESPKPTRPRRRRGGLWLAIVVVVLAGLWGIYWYAAHRIAGAAFERAAVAAGARGMPVACSDGRLGGFPLTLEGHCSRLSVAAAGTASGEITGVSATAPLYWPGYVGASALGPLVLNAPDAGVALTATWTSADSHAEVGLGGLIGASANFTGLDVKSTGDRLPVTGIAAVSAHAEGGPGDGGYRFAAAADDLQLAETSGRDLPAIDGDVVLTALGLGRALGTDPVETLRAWAAAGGTVRVDRFRFAAAGVTADADGTLALSPEGLLSGTLQLRLGGMEALPDLAETLHPGSRDTATKALSALSFMSRQVETPDGPMRQTTLVIRNGTVALGIIPIGTIPPIRF